MRAADIGAIRSVSRPTMHPDGTRVVVSVTRPDLGADATVGQLFTVPLDGSGTKRITQGFRDTAPAFSSDGLALAFLRSVANGPSQIYVVPAEGGEPIPLTDRVLGVTEFRWSPDSMTIAYLSRDPELGRYGSTPGIIPAAEAGRRFSDLRYKSNGVGYITDRRVHVFTVQRPPLHAEPVYPAVPHPGEMAHDAGTLPESIRVTDGDFDHSSIRWNGRRIVVVSARHAGRNESLTNQIWIVAPGERPLPLLEPVLSIETIEIDDDGDVYLLAQDVGESGTDFVARSTSLYRLQGATPVRLTDSTIDLGGLDPHFMVQRGRALVTERTRGTHRLLEVTAQGDMTALSSGESEIEGHASSGDHVVVSYCTPDSVGDVGLLTNGQITPLTDFSAALRATGVVEPHELTVLSRDGATAVHGWVVVPETAGPHPTLLMIHGGPFSAYSVGLLDEPQVYADAGFAVVFCNPRGSAGYGEEFGRAVRGRLGSVDADDVIDFLGGAIAAHPELDSAHLGILGGSYGGYLTAWIIAHDHRFRAAVVERGYLDPDSFVGSSDIGWFFPREYNGTVVGGERVSSPQSVARNVRTPTLIIHSEDDLRCPIGQAENYFATLKLNGNPTEMLVFPGENHELSRSGRPRHRVQRFDAITEWMAKHL